MREDIQITWLPFEEHRSTVFSSQGALRSAANWASFILLGGIAVAGFMGPQRAVMRRRWLIGMAAVTIATGLSLFFALPKVPVEVSRGKMSLLDMHSLLYWEGFIPTTNQAEAQDIMLNLLDRSGRKAVPRNAFQAGLIKEEDSPGNYTLVATNGGFKLILYDAAGSPHFWVDREAAGR
jgi:hypothetical protein